MIQKKVCNLIKGDQSRKCLLILLFILCPFFLFGAKIFTGNEWIVNSYESVIGMSIRMNLPKKIIDRNIYELNEKGELIKIRKSEGFLFTGNNDYQIKAIETIKKVNYLPVVLNKQTYYLSLKDYDYLPLMENWEVYIAIIEKMKRRYSQLKPNVRFPGLGYTGGEKTIEWQWFNYEYLGCEGGRNVYNVYFSFKLDKSIYSEDRINITWIDDSFFYTPKELQAIQDSIDMQMRKDSLEDYKAHAFTPVRKIFTASL